MVFLMSADFLFSKVAFLSSFAVLCKVSKSDTVFPQTLVQTVDTNMHQQRTV